MSLLLKILIGILIGLWLSKEEIQKIRNKK
jgi:uncharacterized protein YneF (UPF0154 family)